LLFKIASRLGVTVNWLSRNLEYSEFLEWIEFFNIEAKQYEKQDYYLAQIAAFLSGQKKAKIKDFLIKFGNETKPALKISPQEQIKIFKKVFGIRG
jgi:uncharacterized Zn finger protein